MNRSRDDVCKVGQSSPAWGIPGPVRRRESHEVHVKVEGVIGFVIAVPLAACAVASQIGLMVIAFKAERLSRELGGDPPNYWAKRFLWGPVPAFWEYLRRQCRRTNDDRLHRLVRVAEVFLVTRMIVMVLVVVWIIVTKLVR